MPLKVGKPIGTLHEVEEVDHPIVKFFKTIGNIIGGVFALAILFGILGVLFGGK